MIAWSDLKREAKREEKSRRHLLGEWFFAKNLVEQPNRGSSLLLLGLRLPFFLQFAQKMWQAFSLCSREVVLITKVQLRI